MRGLSAEKRQAIEARAKTLLRDAVREHGVRVPSSNRDYCEVFGMLMGVAILLGRGAFDKLRLEPGCGPFTHADVYSWYREILEACRDELAEEPTK